MPSLAARRRYLLAGRRLRVSPRVVKRAISKYNARGPTINRTSYKATMSIDILIPAAPLTTGPGPYYPALRLGLVGCLNGQVRRVRRRGVVHA